ncbi:MAG TPA: hypothetical protein VMZ71_02910, partial [Gemmataceae bacterium]|nr:hypothetical protein [Gemmataceae bacterium]
MFDIAAAPPSFDTVTRAAELRAEGKSWEFTARELEWESADELRTHIDRNEKAYDRALRRARREVLNDSFAEGVFTLRRLMRAKEDAVAMKAADVMIRFRATTIRHRKKLKPGEARPPHPSNETLEFVQFLEGHTDQQLHELVMACRRDEATEKKLLAKLEAEERAKAATGSGASSARRTTS